MVYILEGSNQNFSLDQLPPCMIIYLPEMVITDKVFLRVFLRLLKLSCCWTSRMEAPN